MKPTKPQETMPTRAPEFRTVRTHNDSVKHVEEVIASSIEDAAYAAFQFAANDFKIYWHGRGQNAAGQTETRFVFIGSAR